MFSDYSIVAVHMDSLDGIWDGGNPHTLSPLETLPTGRSIVAVRKAGGLVAGVQFSPAR